MVVLGFFLGRKLGCELPFKHIWILRIHGKYIFTLYNFANLVKYNFAKNLVKGPFIGRIFMG